MGKRYSASITASPAMKVFYFRAVTWNLAATHGLWEIPCSRMGFAPKLPEYRISCEYIARSALLSCPWREIDWNAAGLRQRYSLGFGGPFYFFRKS